MICDDCAVTDGVILLFDAVYVEVPNEGIFSEPDASTMTSEPDS